MLLSDKEQLNFGNMREIREFFFFFELLYIWKKRKKEFKLYSKPCQWFIRGARYLIIT